MPLHSQSLLKMIKERGFKNDTTDLSAKTGLMNVVNGLILVVFAIGRRPLWHTLPKGEDGFLFELENKNHDVPARCEVVKKCKQDKRKEQKN